MTFPAQKEKSKSPVNLYNEQRLPHFISDGEVDGAAVSVVGAVVVVVAAVGAPGQDLLEPLWLTG